jgi:hypothetical protein
VRDAVNHLYEKKKTDHLFLDTWGAQIALNLTIEEKSEVSPSVSWLPNAIFSLAGGMDVSADATRTDIINAYHTIKEIRERKSCTAETRPGGGAFLLSSDLKLEDLLFDSVTLNDTKQNDLAADVKAGPLGQNVISHEVKFVVISSGNITPAWKLSRIFSVNSTGAFLSAQRNRTHDLTITLGPTDDTGKAPAPQAADVALSSQIGIAISNGVRKALQQ